MSLYHRAYYSLLYSFWFWKQCLLSSLSIVLVYMHEVLFLPSFYLYSFMSTSCFILFREFLYHNFYYPVYIHGLCSGGCGGVATDEPLEPAQCGLGGPVPPPPPLRGGGPNLPGGFLKRLLQLHCPLEGCLGGS